MKSINYFLGTLSFTLVSLSALADNDNNRARELLISGEIVSVESLLPSIRQYGDWQILEIELEHDDKVLIYEIELLDKQGRVHELKFDAKTGKELADD